MYNPIWSNSDIATTYLGMSKMRRQDELKAEHKAPTTEDCYILGKLLYSTDCKILLDTGVRRSFISKTFNLNCLSLHSLPKFVSKTKKYFSRQWPVHRILFVIPVVISLQEYRFEVYTLVSEMHVNLDMVIGIKNVYEIEGVISTRDSCLHFLSRSIPFFPKIDLLLNLGNKV